MQLYEYVKGEFINLDKVIRMDTRYSKYYISYKESNKTESVSIINADDKMRLDMLINTNLSKQIRSR